MIIKSTKLLHDCPPIKFIEGKNGNIQICPIIESTKGDTTTQYIAINIKDESGVHLIVVESKKGKGGKPETKETEKYFPKERIITCSSDGKPIYGISGEGGVTWRSQT